MTANRLRRRYSRAEMTITVIDQDDSHLYQPGLLFVPFGLSHIDGLSRPRRRPLGSGIRFVEDAVDQVDIQAQQVYTAGGATFDYDVLVVASGAVLNLDDTEGLSGPGWMEKVFTFYTPDGAAALARALAGFQHGRIAVNVIDMPIKCPVAPLEFCFLADWYFTQRGIRNEVELTYVTPLDGAFTKPVASRHLGGMLAEKDIKVVPEFNTGRVDGSAGRLVSYDEREVEFDLAVVVPLHEGAGYVGRSPGLGDPLDFISADERTLQASAAPNIFAIGDAVGIPASKAGSVAHFEGEALVENIARHLSGQPLLEGFDGHANCFIETGYGRALLIDFNYDQEPVPGHYPGTVGLPLLKESRINHLAKGFFESVYWHGLLPGRELPGITSSMPLAGKYVERTSKE